jgi:hypothetical protein
VLGGLVSALAAAALVAAGRVGAPATAAVIAILVALIAIGWGPALELPDPLGGMALVALSGWGAEAAVLLLDRTAHPLALFAAAIAAALLLAFVRELARRDGRADLVGSVTGTLSGEVLAVLASGWVLLPELHLGRSCVVLTAVIAAAAALADGVVGLLRVARARRAAISAAAGVLLAVAAGVVAARFLQPVLTTAIAVTAVAVAAVVTGMGVLFAEQRAARRPLALLAVSAGRIAAAGTVAYAVLRLIAPS